MDVTRNVWKEREEFYRSAVPKDEYEERHMLQVALQQSQLQQQINIRQLWQQPDISQLSVSTITDDAYTFQLYALCTRIDLLT